MKHFIITGAKHAVTSTYALKLKDILAFNCVSAGGFLCEGTFKEGQRDSFFIKSLLTYEKVLIADKNKSVDSKNYSFGSFTFYKKGFEFAYNEYEKSLLNKRKIIFIDEIGKWELEGGGFAALFNKMPVQAVLAAVCRYDFVKDINSLFFNNNAEVINIDDDILLNAEKIKNHIYNEEICLERKAGML